MRKFHMEKKIFLDERAEYADTLVAVIEDSGCEEEEEFYGYSCFIALSDSRNSVRLFFDLNSAEERSNSLNKIRLISETINEFREALELESCQIEARQQSDDTGERWIN